MAHNILNRDQKDALASACGALDKHETSKAGEGGGLAPPRSSAKSPPSTSTAVTNFKTPANQDQRNMAMAAIAKLKTTMAATPIRFKGQT